MLLHADYFIDMAIELTEKGKLDEREVLFPLDPITPENVDEYIASQE